MIINPIIPIWLMVIICVVLLVGILYNNHKMKIKKLKNNKKRMNTVIEIVCIILIFIINLRIMLPNGETNVFKSDINVLFVIDTSVSMRALDYDGNKERFEGVINDCCYIVNELSGCNFSIITFGDTAQQVIPFTADTDMIQAELKTISLENDSYAKGTSLNLVKNELEKVLKKLNKDTNEQKQCVVFFISDGEITKQDESLENFSNIKQYASNGAIMGYGTSNGGKMINSTFKDATESEMHYLYYYDANGNMQTGISKIDENNLKKLSADIGIDYIKMDKTSNIKYKIDSIKEQMNESLSNEDKALMYKDIYYIFAIPLGILLIIKFKIVQKRLLQ